jgi:hypothetical protein
VKARSIQAGVILLAASAAVVPVPAAWVERAYSERAYLALERHLTAWSNRVPFAVTDVVLSAAVTAGGWILVQAVRRARRAGHSPGPPLFHALTVAAVVYMAFLATWGLNYRRPPLRSRLKFAADSVTPGAALALARHVVERLNAFRAVESNGAWPAWEDLPRALGPSFARVQRELADVDPAVAGVPKRSLLAWYLDRAGVSGVTNPFVLEVVVDAGQLPFERPFVTAHEWAHLAGYADESEANFVGWLVCLQGPPTAVYSAHLALLGSLLGALTPSEGQAVVGALDPGPREDARAIQRRLTRVWPALERPAWWIYDRYLHANRVELGVRSYGHAVELMLGTRFREGWVPVRR